MSRAVSTTKNRYRFLDDQEPRWFAVYTRFKREKLVHQRLHTRGVDSYLPLQHVTRHYTRKIKHLQIPLIPCYVFTRITRPEYVRVLEDPDVVRFVRVAEEIMPVPEEEIAILRRVAGEGIPVAVEPGHYHIGDEVEIIGGQLTGLRGTLVEIGGQRHFVIELESIGQSLRMEIDPKYLQAPRRRA